jgi:formylglycine-generating enzyme required for sulfatase activity
VRDQVAAGHAVVVSLPVHLSTPETVKKKLFETMPFFFAPGTKRSSEMRMGSVIMILMALMAVASGADNEGPAPKKQPPSPATKVEAGGPMITLDLGGGITLEAVPIPAGKFLMGRMPTEKDKEDDRKKAAGTYKFEWQPNCTEYPQHEVTITKAFYMGKFEVTNEQFEKVMGYIPSSDKNAKNPADGGGGGKGKNAKDRLSWNDTQIFCKKISELTGKTVRLPTEAEWEYAARAGGPPVVFDKVSIEEVADSIAKKPVPVGQKKPNAWGLYDLFGNVYEWTQDWATPYTADPIVDPRGPMNPPATSPGKVVRGGCYYRGAHWQVTTMKFQKPPDLSRGDIGFRVVVEAPEVP